MERAPEEVHVQQGLLHVVEEYVHQLHPPGLQVDQDGDGGRRHLAAVPGLGEGGRSSPHDEANHRLDREDGHHKGLDHESLGAAPPGHAGQQLDTPGVVDELPVGVRDPAADLWVAELPHGVEAFAELEDALHARRALEQVQAELRVPELDGVHHHFLVADHRLVADLHDGEVEEDVPGDELALRPIALDQVAELAAELGGDLLAELLVVPEDLHHQHRAVGAGGPILQQPGGPGQDVEDRGLVGGVGGDEAAGHAADEGLHSREEGPAARHEVEPVLLEDVVEVGEELRLVQHLLHLQRRRGRVAHDAEASDVEADALQLHEPGHVDRGEVVFQAPVLEGVDDVSQHCHVALDLVEELDLGRGEQLHLVEVLEDERGLAAVREEQLQRQGEYLRILVHHEVDAHHVGHADPRAAQRNHGVVVEAPQDLVDETRLRHEGHDRRPRREQRRRPRHPVVARRLADELAEDLQRPRDLGVDAELEGVQHDLQHLDLDLADRVVPLESLKVGVAERAVHHREARPRESASVV
mmetsp:Transcript_19099/g.57314  ORF Transcript_19099/g.57314 Transcript_19099/m.57314 type:complete len:528 (-) Transcript_19099:2297-3880(-)